MIGSTSRIAGTIIIASAILAMLGGLHNATAFWSIWQKSEPPDAEPVVVQSPLEKVRKDSTCGDSRSLATFGETSFMRGEASRSLLSEDEGRILAAAYMAERVETSRAILEPLLSSSDGPVRDAARIAAAFIIFRRSGPALGDVSKAEIKALLSEPIHPDFESDRHYLAAVLALEQRDWPAVTRETERALRRSPRYYNARVLHTLGQLAHLLRGGFSAAQCEANMIRVEDLLLPLVELGACPMHVAHVDLAAARYLPEDAGPNTERLRLARRFYLAYVSRNDTVRRDVSTRYQERFGSDGCLARMLALKD